LIKSINPQKQRKLSNRDIFAIVEHDTYSSFAPDVNVFLFLKWRQNRSCSGRWITFADVYESFKSKTAHKN